MESALVLTTAQIILASKTTSSLFPTTSVGLNNLTVATIDLGGKDLNDRPELLGLYKLSI